MRREIMNLPIPSHLKDYFLLDDNEHTEYEVSGSIRCKCGSEHFEIFSSNDRQLVKVKCKDCGEEIVLFDAGKHGWDGYVCKDDFLDRNGSGKDGFLNMPAAVVNYYVNKCNLKLSAMYQFTGRYGHANQLDRDNDDLGLSTHSATLQLQYSF